MYVSRRELHLFEMPSVDYTMNVKAHLTKALRAARKYPFLFIFVLWPKLIDLLCPFLARQNKTIILLEVLLTSGPNLI